MRDLLQLGLGNALTAAALAALVWLAATCWRRPQAAWWLWALVLAKLAAPPLFALPVRVDAWRSGTGEATMTFESSQSLTEVYAATQTVNSDRSSAGEPSRLSRGIEVAVSPAEPTFPTLFVLELLALAAWAAGSLLLLSVAMVRVVRFHRLVRQTPCAGNPLQRQADELARRLGLRRLPQVRVVEARLAPLVWAVGRRAQVLLPAALLRRLNDEQTTALLAHELVHLRRRDPWMRWFETLAVVLHWWNPVAWWARSRLQQAEEECCDAAVLSALPGSARAYAAALLETVDFLSEGPAAAPLLASGFGRVNLLKRRFEMILQGSRSRLSWRGRAVLIVVAAAVIPCSAYAVWGEEDASSLSVIERLERLERLVERLLAREEAKEPAQAPAAQEAEPAAPQSTQDRLAVLVDVFNHYIDREEWDDAERAALQAREIAPDEDVVASMLWKVRFIKAQQVRAAQDKDDETDASEWVFPHSIENDRPPFGTKTRREWLQKQGSRATPAEIKIKESLDQLVEVQFDNQPLSKVIEKLSEIAGINIQISEQGLAAEGVAADVPLTIQLREPVSLRSALNQILAPYRLSFVIRNEVLEITSEQVRRPDTITKVYNVADLVVPIPNLVLAKGVASESIVAWLQQTQRFEAHQQENLGAWLQQQGRESSEPANATSPAIRPDFDSLTKLITSTIEPQNWQEQGGFGAVAPHSPSLSLVISQTREAHEQIAELLDQIRRVLDVQIVMEARFLRIPHDLLERLGADLDVIDPVIRPVTYAHVGEDGLERIGVDFDVETSEAPPAQTIGIMESSHAILSDAQTRALFAAVQTHRDALIHAAPKLTTINGQRAFVSFDSPVSREAKPGILSKLRKPKTAIIERESIALAVQGVASGDLRSVRLTVAPMITRSAQVVDSAPVRSAAIAEAQDSDPGPTVTANIPAGSALLMDGGELAGAGENRKSASQRLLLLVTPRILVMDAASQPAGNSVD